MGKRDDDFHEICTAFQTVSLHDLLTFSESDRIELGCDNPEIAVDETNLIVRAAHALKKEFAVRKGAKIRLEKNIPAPGGLGGGSSDAAVALLGLVKLWEVEIDRRALFKLGAGLGSDVPFFFYGGTALGVGRGTEITPLSEEIEKKFLLIITPRVDIQTREAFARLNAPRLTKADPKSILKICRKEAENLLSRQTDTSNDFESVIFKIEPEIRRVRERLLETGARWAQMSGSGASVFGVFENEETRQASLDALKEENDWRKFAVATVSRAEYRERLRVVSDQFL